MKNRMLYYKLLTIPIDYTLRLSNLHNNIILQFTKKYAANIIQLPHQLQLNESDINLTIKKKSLENDLRTKTSNIPLIINDKTSDKFVTLIKDDLLKNMSHVIEINPGFGILTKKLLEAGVPFINLYEKRKIFYSDLENLKSMFPNQIEIYKQNFLSISKIIRRDNTDPCTPNLNTKFPIKKWEEESNVQIIGVMTDIVFIRHLILSVIFQSSIMSYGRPIFYFAMLPSILNILTSYKTLNRYKRKTYPFMFNTIFNYKVFGVIDTKGLMLNISKSSMYKTKYSNEIDSSLLYIVKLEPKSDLFTLFNDKTELIHFWHFIRHYFYRKSKVIQELEKIVPGIGIKLILKDYTIFTEFRELSDSEVIDIYKMLKNCPEFKDSTFLISANEIKEIHSLYQQEEYH